MRRLYGGPGSVRTLSGTSFRGPPRFRRQGQQARPQLDFARRHADASQLRRDIQKLEDMTAKLYEDKMNGVIGADAFVVLMRKNERERQAKQERLDALLPDINKAGADANAVRGWMGSVRKYLDLRELDRAIVDELIDRIEIGERVVADGQRRQEIKVFYRFVGLLD